MFKPINKIEDRQPKYYEKIIESIRIMMINGELAIGGKLPSERDLAVMFNVSRVPVREAIKVLEFMGVVRNVPGEGMFIQNIDIIKLCEKLDFAIETSGNTLEELFEIRLILETWAVKLAAQRRTEKDIKIMKEVISKNETCIKKDIDTFESASVFHKAVIKAAKNKVLFVLYESLDEFLNISKEKTQINSERRQTSLNYHKDILEKIIAQDPEGAMLEMQEHLLDAKQMLRGKNIID